MSLLDQLVDMGERALAATADTPGIEAAINWIMEAPQAQQAMDQSAPAAPAPVPSTTTNAAAAVVEPSGATAATKGGSVVQILDLDEVNSGKPPSPEPENSAAVALSIKCVDCNHICANTDMAALHSERTGHINFEESQESIKPITAEEKAEKRAKLEELIKKRRIQSMEEEKKANIEMEKKRRNQGQEITAAKARMEEQKMKEIVEDRKREKRELAQQKKDILEKIKRDKDARLGLKREEEALSSATSPAATINAPAAVVSDTDHCKIQFRLPSGKCQVHEFGAKEPLSAVRLYLQLHRQDLPESERATTAFKLLTTYPKRTFNEEDMQAPLNELGLVPSAVLVVQRAQ